MPKGYEGREESTTQRNRPPTRLTGLTVGTPSEEQWDQLDAEPDRDEAIAPIARQLRYPVEATEVGDLDELA